MENVNQEMEALITKAQKIVANKLAAANNLIDDVKQAMVHGTDCITTMQLAEWAMAVPIICEELTPYKEAYALTKELWAIDNKKEAAKNLLELDKKKVEIERLNVVAGVGGAQNKAIANYMLGMLGGTQEALWMLANTLRKIMDARIMNRETK